MQGYVMAVYAVIMFLSVHPSQVRFLPRWLNLGSRKQRRMIAKGL